MQPTERYGWTGRGGAEPACVLGSKVGWSYLRVGVCGCGVIRSEERRGGRGRQGRESRQCVKELSHSLRAHAPCNTIFLILAAIRYHTVSVHTLLVTQYFEF